MRKRGTGRPPGRPTKLTEAVLEKVKEARRLSMTIVKSAMAAGISEGAHEDYMRRGREDDAAGRNTLAARYFREVPLAEAEGAFLGRRMARQISRNPKATIVDVLRAKLRLSLETMADASRQGWAKVRIQRRELELRAPPPPAVPEERESVPLRRLSAEDFTRYQVLAERLRTRFDEVTPEEVRELQALIRKAKEAGVPSTTEQVPGAEHLRG